MKTDEIVFQIMADIDQVEQLFQKNFNRPEIEVLMTYNLLERLQAHYRGFVFMLEGVKITLCGYPVRKCSGDGLEYFISVCHGYVEGAK